MNFYPNFAQFSHFLLDALWTKGARAAREKEIAVYITYSLYIIIDY